MSEFIQHHPPSGLSFTETVCTKRRPRLNRIGRK